MIKEDKVLVKINLRNQTHYKNLNYDINIDDKEIFVTPKDMPTGSKVKITAICKLCNSESNISYNKYLLNFNRNNKGYYSCFKCKNVEKEKTCMVKYGVISYSMTDEFKTSESKKWKGVQKGSEKGKITMVERYGVDCYFKTKESIENNRKWMSSDEFKEKSKITLMDKYGVDHYSKSDKFKYDIKSKKDIIIEKIKNTFLEKYGVDWISKSDLWKESYRNKVDSTIEKIAKTCMLRYDVDNVSKVNLFKDKIYKTKLEKGLIISNELMNEWEIYKLNCRKITNKNKKILFEKWDGYDYYDNEFIKGNFCYSPTHRFYPTIDHKISVYHGFINEMDPSEICSISNLCITKRFINSIKGKLIESNFNI